MKRKIIHIDEAKCTGCELCVQACHEGAIGMVDGKAKLLREDYCDGLGDCLPACPADAISFVEREALAYDEEAVLRAQQNAACECPSVSEASSGDAPYSQSRLGQWPIQIKIMPIQAPYYEGSDLLIAADCTAYAFADFHERYMKGKTTIIGCPKLDAVDYSEKLADIFTANNIKSITVLRMEVPCCKGLALAAEKALEKSGKDIPFNVHILTVDGKTQE